MTEAQWFACTDARQMVWFLKGKVSDRKLRLFACACARRIWELMAEPECRTVLEASEHAADGAVATPAAQAALEWLNGEITLEFDEWFERIGRFNQTDEFGRSNAQHAGPHRVRRRHLDHVRGAAALLLGETGWHAAYHSPVIVTQVVQRKGIRSTAAEAAYQASLLRHMVDYPVSPPPPLSSQPAGWFDVFFRSKKPGEPAPPPPVWPPRIVELAQTLYDGGAAALRLPDALLEAGHDMMADHFQQEHWHPKGCAALDLILGKD